LPAHVGEWTDPRFEIGPVSADSYLSRREEKRERMRRMLTLMEREVGGKEEKHANEGKGLGSKTTFRCRYMTGKGKELPRQWEEKKMSVRTLIIRAPTKKRTRGGLRCYPLRKGEQIRTRESGDVKTLGKGLPRKGKRNHFLYQQTIEGLRNFWGKGGGNS